MLAKEAVETALNAELDEHLGMWLSENEGAKCADGVTKSGGGASKTSSSLVLMGLKASLTPSTPLSLTLKSCSTSSYSMKYVQWKDYKAVAVDLKAIY